MTEGEETTTAVSRVVLPKPKKPVGRPPKHGGYSGAELIPIALMKEKEIREVLSGERIVLGKGDRIMVTTLARAWAKIELFDRFFAACGMFDEENKARAGDLKVYLAALNTVARMCDMMGLTPTSRVRLGLGMIQAQKDLGSMMSETNEEDPR
jgi:hypothetical protein